MKNQFIAFIAVGAAATSILAACSSSSSGAGSAADACESYASATLAYAVKCQGGIDPSQISNDTARFTKLCNSALSLKGVADYTGELQSCASAIQNADCKTDIEQLAACKLDDKPGSLSNGSSCSSDIQCQSGSCNTPESTSGGADGGTATNCGTCAAAIADGADCTTGGQCVQGDECTLDSSSGSGGSGPTTYSCKPTKGPGDVGATCESSSDCKSPNHCAYDSSSGTFTGSCAAPVSAGGSCEVSNDCASGLVCVAGASSGTGEGGSTCATPKKEGDSCSGGDCDVNLGCDTTSNKCTKVTYAAPGAACDDIVTLCSKGYCVRSGSTDGTGAATGTCPTILADGAACTTSGGDATSQCDFAASCEDGTCQLGSQDCH